jgi:AcrR family transcriptional regulator
MEDKKTEIINNSSTLFMRYGVKAVTMDDLAKHLGVSKKTFYKYFKDKNDLVLHILNAKIEEDKIVCRNCIDNSENAIDELIMISKFVSEMFKGVHSSVFYDLKKYHRSAWNVIDSHKNGFVKEQIRNNIERGLKESLYRKNINKDVVSSVYIASMNSVFDGESYSDIDLNLSEILLELIRFQIRGMVNENGLDYLKERIKKEEHV